MAAHRFFVRGEYLLDNATADSTIVLAADNIRLSFGRIHVLEDVSFNIKQDEILSIIGPNGAGKTSLMNCLSGFYRPQEGQVEIRDRDITRMQIHRRAHLGMGRTFQGIQLFPHMTVLDNLMADRHVRMQTNFLQSFIHWPSRLCARTPPGIFPVVSSKCWWSAARLWPAPS